MPKKLEQSPTILAFYKAPRLGTVKTRLATTIGNEQALRIYRHLSASQLERLPREWSLEIHYTPSQALGEMQNWLGTDRQYQAQSEGDLGSKLSFAIQGAFERGAGSVVCIGADCPELDAARLDEARSALEAGADAVYGPSEDGGYYLVALPCPIPELFEDIPWSASSTLEASLAKAEQLGLRVALLPSSFDIDEAADLQRAIAFGLLPESVNKRAPLSELDDLPPGITLGSQPRSGGRSHS